MTLECGCIIYNEPRRVGFCPLHDSAGKMLQALQLSHGFLVGMFRRVPDDKILPETRQHIERMRAAIAAAEAGKR